MIDACIQEEFIKMGITSESAARARAAARAPFRREWKATQEQIQKARKSVKEMLEKHGIISE